MRKRTVVLFAVIIVLWLGTTLLSRDLEVPTVFSFRPSGAQAFFQTLDRLEWEPQTFLHPYGRLAEMHRDAALFVVAPTTFGGETELVKWVESGNTLVVFDHGDRNLAPLRAVLGLRREGGTKSAVKLGSNAPESRFSDTISCPASVAQCAGLKAVSGMAGTLRKDGADVLATRGTEPTVLRIQREKGEVWWFAGLEPIQNAFIDKVDNFDLLFKIATSRSIVLFDEFHHGFLNPAPLGREGSVRGLQVLAVYLGLALALVALSRSIRFGPPRPDPVVESTASADFATALGMLYADHGAYEALPAYLRSWRIRLERSRGISRLVPAEEVTVELVRTGALSPESEDRLQNVINQLGDGKNFPDEASIKLLESVVPPEQITRSNHRATARRS